MRGLRRLQHQEQLPVGAAARDRVRREAADPRLVVQPRLHVPRRRLPVVRHDHAQARLLGRAAIGAAAPRHLIACRCRRATLPDAGAADRRRPVRRSTSPGSAAPAWSPPTGSSPPPPRTPASSSAAWTRPACRRRRARSCRTCTSPPTATRSARPRSAAGGADLYLSGDILQAAGANHLARVDPATRSRWSTATSRRPRRCSRPTRRPPDLALLEQAIGDRVGDDRVVFVDAQADRGAAARQPRARQRRAARRGVPGRRSAALARRHRARHRAPGAGRLPTTARRSSGAGGSCTTAPRSTRRWPRPARAQGTGSIFDPSPEALAIAAQLVAGRDRARRRCASCSPGAPRRSSTTRAARSAVRYLDLVVRAAKAGRRGARLGADPGGRRVVVQAAHLQGRVRGRPPPPQARLRPRRTRPRHRRASTRSRTTSTRRHCGAWGCKKKLPMGKPYAAAFRVLRAHEAAARHAASTCSATTATAARSAR